MKWSVGLRRRVFRIWPTVLVLACLPLAASAQHTDIWLIANGTQIAVSPTDLSNGNPNLVDATTGKYLFTGDFGDLSFGAESTDNPGFNSASGTFPSGDLFNFRAVGELWFWNGHSWVNDVPDAERISIEDGLSALTYIDVNGVTKPVGPVNFVDSFGEIHEHQNFTVDNTLGTGSPAPGAYMIELEWFLSDGIGGPETYGSFESARIAFNYQLSNAEFDTAIAFLTNPPSSVNVPFPALFLLPMAFLLVAIQRLSRRA